MLEKLFLYDFEKINTGSLATLYKKEAKQCSKNSPVLIIFTPFLRVEGLYLDSKNSIVNWFNNDGYDVYMLDWGDEPVNTPTDRYIEDHINELMKVITYIWSREGASIHLTGIWEGALFALLGSIILSDKVKSLTMISNILDYDRIGYLEQNIEYYILPQIYNPILKIASRYNNYNYFAFHVTRNLLTQPLYIWLAKLQKFWEKGFLENYRTALWLSDARDIPATTFNEIIDALFHKNELVARRLYHYDVEGNRYHLSLDKVNTSVFNVVSTEDNLAPCIGCLIEKNFGIKDYINYWFKSDTFTLITKPDSKEAIDLKQRLLSWMENKDSGDITSSEIG
jgi:poly(3-hydroxyalkanoate) synthetase